LNKRYVAALLAVTIVLITLRIGYSLALWQGSVDPDPWKLIGDTSRYVLVGHYSPNETQSMYYGTYSVGLEGLLAALTVFTGIDLITLAQYFLQIATPIIMVLVIYLITSRSGTVTSWALPVMILLIGLFSGIVHQQSRMIEENVGFVLFCGALFFLYLYYNQRISRAYTFSMLTAILLVVIFTHHISFLMIAVLAMPFVVSTLLYASPAYVPGIFLLWWIYYHVINGYNGVYVGIFFYTAIGLAALYAVFVLLYIRFSRSRTPSRSTPQLTIRARVLGVLSSVERPYVAATVIILGVAVIVYSVATRFQSGYLPYFLPLAPLVVYGGVRSFTTANGGLDPRNARFTQYLFLILILLSGVMALGFVLQFSASRPGALPPNLQSIGALAAVDLGSRLTNWVAFVYGVVATIGLILVVNGARVSRRSLIASAIAVLLALAAVNTAALAANYNTGFAISSPPDSTVVAAALWTTGKNDNSVTMTDYKDEMLYWYYTGNGVTHPFDSELTNYTVLDFIYPAYLTHWNSSGRVGIDYLLLTSTPEKYYYEHLLNGQWKASSQDVQLWQAHLAAVNSMNGAVKIDKIYTNNRTSYYKVVK